jgi:hypothetical protein
MSRTTMYKCDHCENALTGFIGEMWQASILTIGPNMPDVHACSKEHLSLALAKAFGIDVNWKMVDEIERAKASWMTTQGALDAAKDRLQQTEADLASKRSRIAELETTIVNRDRAYSMLEGSHAATRDERNALEKRLAEATAVPTVDGKTPGQVAFEAWTSAFVALYGGKPVKWDPPLANIWDPTAQAVLRAFGQNAVEALGRVRAAIGARFTYLRQNTLRGQALAIIDDELANLSTPVDITDPKKPTKPSEET